MQNRETERPVVLVQQKHDERNERKLVDVRLPRKIRDKLFGLKRRGWSNARIARRFGLSLYAVTIAAQDARLSLAHRVRSAMMTSGDRRLVANHFGLTQAELDDLCEMASTIRVPKHLVEEVDGSE